MSCTLYCNEMYLKWTEDGVTGVNGQSVPAHVKAEEGQDRDYVTVQFPMMMA